MYQIIENQGKRWMTKSPAGDVFVVLHFRVTNGALFEPIFFRDGAFEVGGKDWELIDADAIADKARVLFCKYYPDFEKEQAAKPH